MEQKRKRTGNSSSHECQHVIIGPGKNGNIQRQAKKGLREGVSKVVGAGDTGNINGTFVNAFLDVVISNIDVFAAGVVGGVVREGHSTVVVTEKDGGV